MRPQDIAYHVRREAQERAAGAAAIDPITRRVHLDLAERHAERARQGQASAALPDPQGCEMALSDTER